MTQPTPEAERSRAFDRLLTFVDAIVAIAITLLVLPLVDSVGDLAEGDSVASFLRDHRDLVGAFFLSFFVIASLWQSQHRILRHVVGDSEPLNHLLLLWTVTIVFLPFPTALVAGTEGHQATTKLLYVGTMAASSGVLARISMLISRDTVLMDDARRPDVVAAAGTSVTFVVALAVMLAVPATSYWPLLLLLATDRVVALVRRARSHRGPAPGWAPD